MTVNSFIVDVKSGKTRNMWWVVYLLKEEYIWIDGVNWFIRGRSYLHFVVEENMVSLYASLCKNQAVKENKKGQKTAALSWR